jgi:hypothetical protein
MPNKKTQVRQTKWALIVGAALGLALAQWTLVQAKRIAESYEVCVQGCENRAGRHFNDECPCNPGMGEE